MPFKWACFVSPAGLQVLITAYQSVPKEMERKREDGRAADQREEPKRPVQKVLVLVCCVQGPVSKGRQSPNPHTDPFIFQSSTIAALREPSVRAPTVPHKDRHKNVRLIYSSDSC